MKKILLLIFLASCVNLFTQQIVVEPLQINSSLDDFSSPITKHSNEMYMTSERDGTQKIYKVERSGSNWRIVDEVSRDVNSGSHNGAVALTPDGQYMIFSAYEHNVPGSGRTDLYSARRIEGEWTDVQNLGVAINSEYWDSNPSLSSDGMTLYFASDRPGKGGTDLYYSQRTREGWTKAMPINSLNTASDELSPFIGADNNTFTFASNRSGGEGGYDIYFSKKSGDNFSSPRNAGNVINTSADEYFYVINPNTDFAYFSSSRQGGKGALDIYSAVPNPHPSDEVVFVSGIVRDAMTRAPLGSEIIITDLETGDETAYLRSDDETGEYFAVLQPGKEYSVTSERAGYVFYSERFKIPANISENDLKKDIFLNPIGSGKTRLLVFFDFDKASLKNESKPELQRVIDFLRKNPELKIELHGHTDDQGTNEYNDKLSTDRAKSVKKYLVDGGVQENRIVTKGFGKRDPLINSTTEVARAQNRRVEMVIVE